MDRSFPDGTRANRLQDAIARLTASRVPGVSLAVVQDGAVESSHAAGVRAAGSQQAVTSHTIFEAASLSKPVFAYAVLTMADVGVLSLDEPLGQHLPGYFGDDGRAARITAAHVLTHTTGLPNWRSERYPLRPHFEPGTSFSYSGEGYVYLQAVMERITGEPLEATTRRLVFEPLSMTMTSFVWQKRFEKDFAAPHDAEGCLVAKARPVAANAAFSLHTTAVDYARFLAAATDRTFRGAVQDWFKPRVVVPRGQFTRLDPVADPGSERGVAWGLGWGLEPDESGFFHWGANDAAGAYALGSTKDGRSFVLFVNQENGFAAAPEIAGIVLPGDHPSFRWLGLTNAGTDQDTPGQ